jgi:TatD DNase family protein
MQDSGPRNHLVDIGANLTHSAFKSDLDAVIENAIGKAVTTIIVTGADERGSEEALKLAHRYPDTLYATAGVHPHHAKNCRPETLACLRGLARDRKVVAIGEAGLDYYRDFSPRPLQEKWFEAQAELACELRLPLFMHQRDGHARFCDIARAYRDHLVRGVVHCFTGRREELFAYLDMDLHIGMTGWICDERRGAHLKDLVGNIPSGRLMLETDAPYLVPRDMHPRARHNRNEPQFLPHIVATVAQCLGRKAEDVSADTTRTAVEFFGLSADTAGT